MVLLVKKEDVKMNKQWIVKPMVFLAVVSLMMATPLAYGYHGTGEGKQGRSGRFDFERDGGPECMFKDLGLTQEQQDQLKARRGAEKEQWKTGREALKTKMRALHEEISKPDMDKAKVDAIVMEINTLKGQEFARRTEGIVAMKEILTPEQFAKFQEHHQKKMEKKQWKWKKGPKGGRGDFPQKGDDVSGPAV